LNCRQNIQRMSLKYLVDSWNGDRSICFIVVFCRSLFVVCTFSFDHCIVSASSIYSF
jgi:hypothetical protein